jgi:TATA-binding protein-associated factor Taf7
LTDSEGEGVGLADGLQTDAPTPGGDDMSLGAPTPAGGEEGEEEDEEGYSTDDTDALERDLEAQMQAAEQQEEEDETDESDEDDALEKDLFGGGGGADDEEDEEEEEEDDDGELRDIKRRINLAKDKIRETEPIVEGKKRDIERSTNRIMTVRKHAKHLYKYTFFPFTDALLF